MKKSLIALLLVFGMSFTACSGSGSNSETPQAELPKADSPIEQTTDEQGDQSNEETTTQEGSTADQKIIWAVHNAADTLDPGISNNTFASPILINCFEGLMTYDQDNNLVNGVIESYTISDDGTEYVFTLRDGLKFSDGSDLTADDFIYSWTRVITPETGSNFSTLITDYVKNSAEFFEGKVGIEEVGFKALDPKTIQINTYEPTPYFLSLLSTYTWSAVKKDVVDANPDGWALDASNYVCNGPFKPTKISISEGYILEKNEYYHDADNVKLQQIDMRLIPDNTTALTAFESGEIDGVYDVPYDDIPRLKAESDEMYSISQFAHTYFLFNHANEPLNNVNVRKALALAVDRKQLIENVLQTTDQYATGIVAPGYMVNGKEFTEGRSDYEITAEANIELAKKYLADAGYPNGEGFPKIKLSYYTDNNIKKITEALQQMWKDNLGIEMEITTEEWKVYYDNIQAHNFDIAAMGWGGDYLYPTTFLEVFVSDSVNNNTSYKNETYDQLVKEAMSTVDLTKGAELMRKADDVLMGEDMAMLPLYYRSRVLMMKDTLDGWYLTPLNNMYFKNCVELDG